MYIYILFSESLEFSLLILAVLTSHAVADTYFSAGLNDDQVLPSVAGEGSDINIQISAQGKTVKFISRTTVINYLHNL